MLCKSPSAMTSRPETDQLIRRPMHAAISSFPFGATRGGARERERAVKRDKAEEAGERGTATVLSALPTYSSIRDSTRSFQDLAAELDEVEPENDGSSDDNNSETTALAPRPVYT